MQADEEQRKEEPTVVASTRSPDAPPARRRRRRAHEEGGAAPTPRPLPACDAPLDPCQRERLGSLRRTFAADPDLWRAFLAHTGSGTGGPTKPVAFRTIDWFVTNFCRGRAVSCRGKDIYMEYKTRLRTFHKDFFDPFRRGTKVRFHPEGDDRPDAVDTALCQLNFFAWAISSGVLDSCREMADRVEAERHEANLRKRKRQASAIIKGRERKRGRLVNDRGPGLILVAERPRIDWDVLKAVPNI